MYVLTQKRRQVVRLEILLSMIVMKLAEFSLVELVSRIRQLMVFDWHSCRINKENSFCRLKAMFFSMKGDCSLSRTYCTVVWALMAAMYSTVNIGIGCSY
jgi:hypothetical protein